MQTGSVVEEGNPPHPQDSPIPLPPIVEVKSGLLDQLLQFKFTNLFCNMYRSSLLKLFTVCTQSKKFHVTKSAEAMEE